MYTLRLSLHMPIPAVFSSLYSSTHSLFLQIARVGYRLRPSLLQKVSYTEQSTYIENICNILQFFSLSFYISMLISYFLIQFPKLSKITKILEIFQGSSLLNVICIIMLVSFKHKNDKVRYFPLAFQTIMWYIS